MAHTLKDVIQYVKSNRKRFTDRVYDDGAVNLQIFQAWEMRLLYVFTEPDTGEIIGVAILWHEDDRPGEMEVTMLVTTSPKALRIMYNYYRQLFPTFKLYGLRRGKEIQYDMKKLDKKLHYKG